MFQIVLLECGVDGGKHPLFVRTPQRRQQISFGSVAGETMDHHLPGNVPQACFQNLNIGILFQARHGSGTPERFQVRAAQYMEQMKLVDCKSEGNI